MRKYISVIILIMILMSTCMQLYCYGNEENEFFALNTTEIEKNETLEMTIYLEKIPYHTFQFTLQSNIELENIEVGEEIEIEQKANEMIMTIQKEEININSITLYYQIPQEIEIGSKITFSATITNLENEEEMENIEKEITIIEEIEEPVEEGTEKLPIEDAVQPEENTNKVNTENVIENLKESSTNLNIQTTSTISSNYFNTTTETESKATIQYNGSDNNYLSELSVQNYELNKEFSKENQTYFVTIENTETLDIVATAKNENATVCIYGADNLKEGTNKILITVTAENGDVRNYRIFVTKNN